MLELIKKYKLPYVLYNLFNKKRLQHNISLYKKYKLNKKYYSPISSSDFDGIESPLNIYDKYDSANKLNEDPAFNNLDPTIQEQLKPWSKNGYVIIKNLFSEKEINEMDQEVNRLLENKKIAFKYRNKIMFAIHKSKVLKEAATGYKMLNILQILLGKPVEIFQSINFITGSQQRTHSDSIHMSTFPYGNLIAVWIALEDITADSGPLHYYPGSHKLPYLKNEDYGNEGTPTKLGEKTYVDYEDKVEDILQENNFSKEIFLAKKGDILIWHANLLHGGEAVTNPNATRKSMVLHYYSTDAICYHEVTQRPSLK